MRCDGGRRPSIKTLISENGNVTEFSDSVCWIKNSKDKVVYCASCIYFLDFQSLELANVVTSKEELWHKWLGSEIVNHRAAGG